ncbi:MAG: methyltransferase domain-containing protein [Pseudomonadota bacterium]
MSDQIKTMQLYPRAERIYAELEALGYAADTAVPVEVLNQFDQLHYHGTEALDAAIAACDMQAGQKVLEVGSGWGGCARYLAQTSGADLHAVELQPDYHAVAQDLTARSGLIPRVSHINADFLEVDLQDGGFDHAVSWLALFHIPDRPRYQAKIKAALKPGGMLFAEDLYLIAAPADEADFARHLFPNSLVSREAYENSLHEAGFDHVTLTDMTENWAAFTANRLEAFRTARPAYEARHGKDSYIALHLFYEKMAGYLADGVVGGLRLSARKPV